MNWGFFYPLITTELLTQCVKHSSQLDPSYFYIWYFFKSEDKLGKLWKKKKSYSQLHSSDFFQLDFNKW